MGVIYMAEEQNQEETGLIKLDEIDIDKMNMVHQQKAEQLFHQLGLDPVVNKILKEFPQSLTGMDRVADRMFGPYDIKGRADAVAKITALITYAALGERYGEELGKMESQLSAIAGERDKERTNYDNLVQKVAEIVGGDYDELKTDYDELVDRLAEVDHLKTQIKQLTAERKQLVERVAKVLGEDYAELKTSYSQLLEKLSEVEHLRDEVTGLKKEKEELSAGYEAQLAERDAKLEKLEAERKSLADKLEGLKDRHEQLRETTAGLPEVIPFQEIRQRLGDDLYNALLRESKVPDMVLNRVSKFIDFRRYLGLAAEKGAEEAGKRLEDVISDILNK
jgi:DNA repair exonuclease SbcCD ATPase subunit